MPSTRRMAGLAVAASAAMVASMALHSPASADSGNHDGSGAHQAPTSDIQPTAPDFNNGKKQPLEHGTLQKSRRRGFTTFAATADPQVGDTRKWLAEDDAQGSIYLKDYTLRGVGNNIEVWVADDRAFPGDDCRNGLGLTDITDAQVDSFIKEFDTNIYPKESASFSVPPPRNGADASSYKAADGTLHPIGAGKVGEGRSDDTVVLVDNVRDANYYAPDTPSGQTYIAGFFYSVFNEYADRNIMTIDAYDWLHRTGANPPDDSGDPAYQACAYASGAPRPHLYEGTFAHEYQHLLEYYQDPDEVSWMNEGLSDYAQTLVGYVDTSVPVTDPTADSHLGCFSGFLSDQGYGGPENSLTQWSDQGPPEILCDYGAAYSFEQYLFGHYGGEPFMSALHKEPGNGLTGLENVLEQFGSSDSAMDVVHKWAAMVALDNVIDGGATLRGGDPDAYSEDSLGMQVNWDATYGDINHDGTADDPGNEAYSTPGAPPNGSDYVRLRGGHGPRAGKYLTARDLHRLTFDGSGTLTPDPVEWTVDGTPPDSTDGVACGTTPDGSGGAAFYSGCGASLDRAIVKTVSVPAGSAQLDFDTLYNTEVGWDFGFVQVYDQDSKSYESVACTDTTSTTAAGAIPAVQDNVPGFTGDSGGWKHETCDLSAYAGQDVELAFRYVTDTGVNLAGWWVKNVAVGGAAVADGSSLDGWQSATQAHPTPVNGFTVQLVGYDADGSRAFIGQLPVTQAADGSYRGRLNRHQLGQLLGRSGSTTTVAAVVMQDDPSETVNKYARYQLRVNGTLQPGG